jgi:hypothetical protein
MFVKLRLVVFAPWVATGIVRVSINAIVTILIVDFILYS